MSGFGSDSGASDKQLFNAAEFWQETGMRAHCGAC
jgi:hypothetical protein